MTYRLIGDSCTDLDDNLKNDDNIVIVPLTLEIGDYSVEDDEKFNQKDFIKRMAESKIGAKSACPSPEAFKEAMECDTDMAFVVTLSEHLREVTKVPRLERSSMKKSMTTRIFWCFHQSRLQQVSTD